MRNKPWMDHEKATETLVSIMLFHLDEGNASRGLRAQSVCYNKGLKWLQLVTVKPTPKPTETKLTAIKTECLITQKIDVGNIPDSSSMPLADITINSGQRQNDHTRTMADFVLSLTGIHLVNLHDVHFEDDDFSEIRQVLRMDDRPVHVTSRPKLVGADPRRFAEGRVVDVYIAAAKVFLDEYVGPLDR